MKEHLLERSHATNQRPAYSIRGKMKNTNTIKLVIFIIFTLSTSGCDSDSKRLIDVKTKVDIIQNEYNEKEFEKIYEQTSESFKKAASKEGFITFMKDKFHALGKFKSSKVLFSAEKDGVIINITYISVYEKYTLAEDITFKNEGRGFKLLQYTLDTGGKIVPVTKNKNSMRVDLTGN